MTCSVAAALATTSTSKLALADNAPPECVPTVVVAGEPDLVDAVRAYLASRDIPTQGAHGRCGVLVAVLSSEDGKVRVVVRDASGRDDSRVVTDAATASVFVESRARSDLALALPAPRAAPAEVKPLASPQKAPPVEFVQKGEDSTSTPGVPVAFRFSPGFSLASDESTWLDLAVSGCVNLEPVCVGASMRGALDLGVSGRSEDLLTERAGVDVLVNGEVPVAMKDDLDLVFGLGVGVGWLRSGPRGRAEPASGEVTADFGGVRVEPFASALWGIAKKWTLGVTAFAVVDPTAHTRDIQDPEATLAGNPRVRVGSAFVIGYRTP